MHTHHCAAGCGCSAVNRRQFLASSTVLSASLLGGWPDGAAAAPTAKIEPRGPASRLVPRIRACFVRRRGAYGLRWPGAVYDGEAAHRRYAEQLATAARELKLQLDLRPEPIYNLQEADGWIGQAAAQQTDGLLVVLLDRQEHAWPTAEKAIDSRIPTVVFSPVGTSFTTNTAKPSKKTGCFLCSTDDFRQVRYGLKMLGARAKVRATRMLVIAGRERRDVEMPHVGIKLRYVPAQTFLQEYEKLATDDVILGLAKELMAGAGDRWERPPRT